MRRSWLVALTFGAFTLRFSYPSVRGTKFRGAGPAVTRSRRTFARLASRLASDGFYFADTYRHRFPVRDAAQPRYLDGVTDATPPSRRLDSASERVFAVRTVGRTRASDISFRKITRAARAPRRDERRDFAIARIAPRLGLVGEVTFPAGVEETRFHVRRRLRDDTKRSAEEKR